MSKNRRKRIILQSVVVAFFLTAAWIGVLVGLQLLKSSTYRFRAETQDVLEKIRDGRAVEVYDEASQRFRDTMLVKRFEERATRINQTLGEFKKLLATYDPIINTGPQGKTGYVTVSLEFDKVKTTGSFSYHFVDGKWRLLGLNINIPEELGSTSGVSSEFKKVKDEAPAEVLALITEILERVEAGEGGAVYDEASERLKQVTTREQFLDLLAREKQVLGDFRRVLYITHSWADAKTKANVVCVLEYSKDQGKTTNKTEARFEFDRDSGKWQLLKFKVVLPEPVVPRIPSRDP